MKFYFFLLPFVLLLSCSGESEKSDKPKQEKPKDYFQGELHYTYDYTSDSRNISYIKSKRPKRGVFKYDLQHYQSTFYGPDITSYYYSGIVNKAISSMNGAFDIRCEDYGINPDSLLFFEVHDTDVIIQGQACKVIEFQTPSNYTRYHVSKEVFLAPDTYKNHKAYNWSLYGKQTNGGIILKAEHFFDQFTMIGEISKIQYYKNGERAWDITEEAFKQACP